MVTVASLSILGLNLGPAGLSVSLPVWLSVNKDTYVRLTGVSKLVVGVNERVDVSLCKYGVQSVPHLPLTGQLGSAWKTDG